MLLIRKDNNKTKKKPPAKSTIKKKSVDRNTCIEAQAMMHICNASKCLIAFIDANNHSALKLHEVDREEGFFEARLSEKIGAFFENYILQKVSANKLTVKV